MLPYITINTVAETLCFFVTLFALSNNKDPFWRSLTSFMLIVCVSEYLGIYVKRRYLADVHHVHPNGWVYNILMFFSVGFFSLVFYHLLSSQKAIKNIVAGGGIILIMIHVYSIISQSIYVYDELTKTTMSILFVLYSFIFYYYLLKDDSGFINIKLYGEFWWVTGTLFFYFGTTAYNIYYYKLASFVMNTHSTIVPLKYVYNVLNIFIYSLWSYAFICKRLETKRAEARVLY